MKTAARIGISISEFWDMTAGELAIYVEAYTENFRQNREDQLILAYANAAWYRAKRMPNINKIIKQSNPKKMTNEQMLEVVKKLNEAFGGKVVN